MTSKSNKKERSKVMKSAIDIFAGTIAGINVTLVGHPFDTLKIRLQTQPADKPIYKGLSDCFFKTLKWEGISGFYKGVSSPLVGQMMFRALLFLSYGEAKRFLEKNNDGKLESYHYLIAGGFACCVSTIAECPIDFFKTQTQIQIIKAKTIPNYVPEYKTPAECVKKVIDMNGIKGAYQGLLPQLMRNIPAGAMLFGVFENLRIHFARTGKCEVKDISKGKTFIAGALGGWFYWFFFYPFDVVKSAIQSDNIDKSKRRYKSIIQTYKILYDEGGIQRFYKGFTPCMMRSLPANAVMLLTTSFITEKLS